jgi:putative SOS response-associated peptidase YedK
MNCPSISMHAGPDRLQALDRPGLTGLVRLDRQGRRTLDLLPWGLIPYWARDAFISAHCINAMAETVVIKPAFRAAFRHGRRCLVPEDGFYEWKKMQI